MKQQKSGNQEVAQNNPSQSATAEERDRQTFTPGRSLQEEEDTPRPGGNLPAGGTNTLPPEEPEEGGEEGGSGDGNTKDPGDLPH